MIVFTISIHIAKVIFWTIYIAATIACTLMIPLILFGFINVGVDFSFVNPLIFTILHMSDFQIRTVIAASNDVMAIKTETHTADRPFHLRKGALANEFSRIPE